MNFFTCLFENSSEMYLRNLDGKYCSFVLDEKKLSLLFLLFNSSILITANLHQGGSNMLLCQRNSLEHVRFKLVPVHIRHTTNSHCMSMHCH